MPSLPADSTRNDDGDHLLRCRGAFRPRPGTARARPAPGVLWLIALALLLAACSGRPARDAPGLSPVASLLAESITIQALGLVGTPYRYGGNTPAGGFDCSGLIGYVYREGAGVSLPRSVAQMAQGPWPTVPRARMVTGDLVFFAIQGSTLSHAGIYVGEGRFVHAPSSGGTVRLDRLDSPYWSRRVRHGMRILR